MKAAAASCERCRLLWEKVHLPLGALLQSVAYLIFGLKQDVLVLRRAGPADGQLVLEVADAAHLHAGRGVCGHCADTEESYKVFTVFGEDAGGLMSFLCL